jgi:hypothetical protein
MRRRYFAEGLCCEICVNLAFSEPVDTKLESFVSNLVFQGGVDTSFQAKDVSIRAKKLRLTQKMCQTYFVQMI